MKLLAFYIFCCFIGGIVGMVMRKKNIEFKWSGKVQTILLILLLGTMGARIGANEQVIGSLGEIGLSAFVLALFCMAGSVAAIFAVRKLMGFSRKGVRGDD